MPDKEFDKLFKDRFEDAEIEPSANLWANIEQQLAPKRKRVFPIYWVAAASVVIAITAMLVFQKTETIQLKGTEGVANVVKPVVVEQDAATAIKATATTLPAATTITSERKLIGTIIKNNAVKSQEIEAPKSNGKNMQEDLQPMMVNNRLPIKQQEVKPLDVVPVKEVQAENPIVIASVATPQNVIETSANEDVVTERKGIRNVGDLVNFVVDKVDKREKKLVRFNTDDDDNSSIVGINIGFLKFNKKNK